MNDVDVQMAWRSGFFVDCLFSDNSKQRYMLCRVLMASILLYSFCYYSSCTLKRNIQIDSACIPNTFDFICACNYLKFRDSACFHILFTLRTE